MGCSLDVYRGNIGGFVSTLQKILMRKAKAAAARIRGLNVSTFAGKVAVTCLLIMLLIGGVELNPGPPPTEDGNSTLSAEGLRVLQGLSETVQSLTGAIHRLEEGQRQLSDSLNGKLSDIQTTLHARLCELKEEQEILRLDVDEVARKQERVEDDTAALKETVQQLTSKMEQLEVEKRKSNLLFFGITKRAGETCEQLIQTVLRQQLKITADVMVEYAYWTGGAILVRFQSLKQRAMVLVQARHLTAEDKLSIREDYPRAVRRRRSGLVELYKQFRRDKKRATLKADKLYTDDGVFGFDTERRQIVQLGPPSSRRQRRQVSMEVPHGATSAPIALASAAHTDDDDADGAMETAVAAGAGFGAEKGGPAEYGNVHRPGEKQGHSQHLRPDRRRADGTFALASHTYTHTPTSCENPSSKN